jgi:hypothetical protein
MAKINLSAFDFDKVQLQAIGELVWEIMREQTSAMSFVTIYPDIKTNKEAGFLGEGGLVGKASSGCDPEEQDFTVSTRRIVWEPTDWEVLLNLCYKDLESTLAATGFKNGLEKPDLTNTEYMNIMVEAIKRALNKFLWRFIWFNSKTAKNFSDGGSITDGVDTSYFTLNNGLWNQIITQCTSAPAQHITIAENSGVSYSAQVITPAHAKQLLQDMYFAAPIKLRQLEDKVFYVTQSVYDAYYQSLSDVATAALESREDAFINGRPKLSIFGVDVIAMPDWDEHIINYNNNGTVCSYPNRALFTSPRVLGLGLDKAEDFDKLDIWYNKDERKVKTEATGNGDSKLIDPTLFVAGY